MAFSRQAPVRQSVQQDDSWMAQGFINLYIPRDDGTRAKIGVITLRDSKRNEAHIRAFLEADPANIKKFMNKLVMEYQNAEPKESSDLSLD